MLETPQPRRRWSQFGLRGLLVATTLLGALLGLGGPPLLRAYDEWRVRNDPELRFFRAFDEINVPQVRQMQIRTALLVQQLKYQRAMERKLGQKARGQSNCIKSVPELPGIDDNIKHAENETARRGIYGPLKAAFEDLASDLREMKKLGVP